MEEQPHFKGWVAGSIPVISKLLLCPSGLRGRGFPSGLTMLTRDTSRSMVVYELITILYHLLKEDRRRTCSGLKKSLIGNRLTEESDRENM